jgi:nicotinate-nucleotide adenylyltransferase
VREIGVFCGTFNPIHWGHLMLAEFARDQFDLEKVIVVTSPNPPHRHQDLLEAETRHELVVAACEDNTSFQPSRLELDRSGPSYTVDTLRAIKEQEDDSDLRLNFLVGQDNLLGLKEWHEAAALFSLCRILVATRTSDVTREEIKKELPATADFALIEFPQVPVSSSIIRTRIRQDKTVLYLLPPSVNEIIETRGLYRPQGAKAPAAARTKHARHTRQSQS